MYTNHTIRSLQKQSFPIGSMYGIFTYICLIFLINVGKYVIHGCHWDSITAVYVVFGPSLWTVDVNLLAAQCHSAVPERQGQNGGPIGSEDKS